MAAEDVIRRTAMLTALTGAASATAVTGATVATTETGGYAAPVVVPLAAMAVGGELLTRSLLHVRMACDLGELYGAQFPPGSERELVGIYALASGAEMHETEDDPGRGIVERMINTQEKGGLDKLVSSNLIEETLLRNIVPYVDIVVSSYRNWQLTQRVGKFMQNYVARRLALDESLGAIRRNHPEHLDLVLEGVWFIFVSDGRLSGIETALLAHLLGGMEDPLELTARFVGDEAGWQRRLSSSNMDRSARDLVLRTLEVAAAANGPVTVSALAVLRRAGEALGRPVDPFAVQRLARQLAA